MNEPDDQQPITEEFTDEHVVHDALSMQFNYEDVKSFPPEVEAEIDFRVDKQLRLAKAEAVAQVICYIEQAKTPRAACHQISWAAGMFINQGVSLRELARRHGVSVPAFQRGAMRFAHLLGIDATRAMRAEESRETFSKTNYRQNKKEINAKFK